MRRSFRALAALCAIAIVTPAAAEMPDRAIRLIVPYPPGGSTDLIARVVAEAASPVTPRGIVIENRGGANGNIAMAEAARSTPDGTTLVACAFGPCGANPALYANPGYDLLADFAPVILTASVRNVLAVRRDLPVEDFRGLVGLAVRQPLTQASSGSGSSNHLAPQLIAQRLGMQLIHVPYRGSGPALTDIVAGRVDMFMDNLPSILPHIRSGAIRALVVTSDSRAPELPDVPSLPEAGVQGMAVESWFGILAPARTPASVLDSLNAAFAQALRGEALRQRLRELGATPMGGSREAMRLHMAAELERWSGVVRQAGLRAE